MKSIKPGRGPSGMSFIGSLAAVAFGIVWTVIAFGMTSMSGFGFLSIFPVFGIIFVIFGIVSAAYSYKNATGKDRYSMFDITDSKEEGDPANKWIRHDEADAPYYGDRADERGWQDKNAGQENNAHNEHSEGYEFCPYCGAKLQMDFSYCPKCGSDV